MKTIKKGKEMIKKTLFLLALLVCSIFWFSSCSAIKEGVASTITPKGFISFDKNINIESKEEEQFAGEIQKRFPSLIDSIEMKLNSKFKRTPTLYICNTNESFCKWSGAKFPGPRCQVTVKGLFISPRLQGKNDWTDIIYHELVHTLMFQYLGMYHYYTIPVWFHEGLATSVSNGGGTGDITDSAAIDEILKGKHFYPHSGFIKSYLNNTHLAPWVRYRQYMLFVKFLENENKMEFNELLNSILDKESFSKSYKNSYGVNINELWKKFTEQIKP
jgi:hypothetical protein